jgi:hypothetical protein
MVAHIALVNGSGARTTTSTRAARTGPHGRGGMRQRGRARLVGAGAVETMRPIRPTHSWSLPWDLALPE